MLNFLPGLLLGILSILLATLNTFVWVFSFIPFILLRIVLPLPKMSKWCSQCMIALGTAWVYCNSGILKLTQKTVWEIEGLEDLSPKKSYLLLANHQSWTDILVLHHVFKGKIPFLMFFLKQELIWVPLLGLAWWALGMPFMKRYSKEYLQSHPEMKGKDLETTRQSCEKFKHYPVSVINFVEGSRFTLKKNKQQNAPYENLLKAKAGGVALTLSAMGDCFDEVLDITIIYKVDSTQNLIWKLMSKQIPNIDVHIQKLPVPQNVTGKNYIEDPEYQDSIKTWINTLWQKKDKLISSKKSD